MNLTTSPRAKRGLAAASRCAAARWTIALASLSAASCAIDDSDACGPHQVYQTGGSALEYAVCVCDEAHGYVFDVQRGYGCKVCADSQTIVDGKCVTPTSDAGSEPTDGATAPTGVGEYCDSDADCASFSAKYCAVQMHSCMIANCATHENACVSDSVCCDYSALLAGFSLCMPAAQLVDGQCPMGGMKVEP